MSFQPANIPKWLSHYTIISELGRGAFSTVYKIKSNTNGNTYCLKKISLKKTGDKLNNEVIINQKLSHINLVKFCDSHVEEDYMYIIMEFCEYGDLYSLLRSVQKHKLYINEDILWDIAYQGLLALEYLHLKKVIHRDIKLLNIFMTKDKLVKIGDMGMSKLIDESVKMNLSRVGTPLYLAPELVKKEQYDYKVDIWSFGCSLYHLAKCTPPFNEENLIRLGNAIVSETPPQLPETYSQEFKYFVNLLMCKSKDVRPTAAMALKLIPEKIRVKYKEKFSHLIEKMPISSDNQSQGSHKYVDSQSDSITSASEIRCIIPKRQKSESINPSENLIGNAGNLIQRQFKFLNNKSKMMQNATQDNFRPNSKDKQQSIKTQTCNNFYNFNINVYKVNFNKKGNCPLKEELNQNNVIDIVQEKADTHININMGSTTTGSTSIFNSNTLKSLMNETNPSSFPKKFEGPNRNNDISNERNSVPNLNKCSGGLNANTLYMYPEKIMNHNKKEGIANAKSLNISRPNTNTNNANLMNETNSPIFPLIQSKNSFTDRNQSKFYFAKGKSNPSNINTNNRSYNQNHNHNNHFNIQKATNKISLIEQLKKPKILTINDLK